MNFKCLKQYPQGNGRVVVTFEFSGVSAGFFPGSRLSFVVDVATAAQWVEGSIYAFSCENVTLATPAKG